MKLFLAIVLLFSLNLFPQETDSTLIGTTKIIRDTFFAPYDSLSHDTSQVSALDTLVKADTLYPIHQTPFYDQSYFIIRETIEQLDYRYTGNFFIPAAFTFLKDRGMIGQPNELLVYGNGFRRTGYFSDGILYNNRFTELLDLNLIQSELIDSVEIVPLPRGFLYGPDNYAAAVNFIEKDFVTPVPYTRIKYYEGPEGEAFVDGIFNTSFLNKFNLFFDITNRNFDGIYTNSDFSIWQANFKLKYFLSNSINLLASYSLVSSELGYFGGVDVDSISKTTNDINSILYDPNFAPVVYPALRQEAKWDKFKLRGFGKFGKFKTDINFYYHAVQEKYSGIPSNDELKNYILGASLRQIYSTSQIKLEVNSVFEKRDLNYYFQDTSAGFLKQKTDYDILSISPVLSLYLKDSTIIPSVFYKHSSILDYNIEAYRGFGADINFKVLRLLNIYLGVNKFDFLNGSDAETYEIGAKLTLNSISADIRYFGKSISNPPYMPSPHTRFFPIMQVNFNDLKGLAAQFHFHFWKIGLEGNFNYSFFKEDNVQTSSEIKMYLNSGIFYKDILFNRNLELKTGFVLKYYDFESDIYESAFQIDYTVAGIIQKVAIVYFSWENLFDEEYFIVPYYPMRERGIRFGLAWELFN
jgi:hypothetical protein